MDEQTEKELERNLEVSYRILDKLKQKMTPEEAEAIKKAVQPELEKLRIVNEQLKKAFEQYQIYDKVQGTLGKIKAMYDALAQAALETQRDLAILGVETGSISDAVKLFKPEAAGAFIGVLNLARQHIETGLLLKDYAEAIRPDLTVNDNFPFKGELEQVLKEAADDIEEYKRELEAEEQEAEKEATATETQAEKLEKAKETREKAAAMGAIMTVNRHLAAPSDKELMQLFTPDNVFLLRSTEQFDKEGKLQEQEGKQAQIERIDTVHTQFLMLVFRLVCLSYDPTSPDKPDDKIIFSIPKILDELGIDARKGNSATRKTNSRTKEQRIQRILELIEPSRDKLARLPKQEQYYKVCDIDVLDREAEIITLNVPYFFRLVEYIAQQKYKDKAINKLFHSTVFNESNTAAVELANRIMAGVKQRGLTRDNPVLGIGAVPSKITTRTRSKNGQTTTKTIHFDNAPSIKPEERRISYKIRWETLILDCPQLTARLNDVMNSDKANKAMYFNRILEDTFKAAYRIIMEKSDAPQYYLDLKFEPHYTTGELIPPTKSKLKQYMIVSHKGKNKSFVFTE